MQAVSLITLGVADLARARRFYESGFGWRAGFEADGICFYQMNGLVLGLWAKEALEHDLGLGGLTPPGAMTLAHNLPDRADVAPLMERLAGAGGCVVKAPIDQPYGGFSGYLADPDGHIWEIAWNPAWTIGADGRVSMGA